MCEAVPRSHWALQVISILITGVKMVEGESFRAELTEE